MALGAAALVVVDLRGVVRLDCLGWTWYGKWFAVVLGMPGVLLALIGLRFVWSAWRQQRQDDARRDARSACFFVGMLLYPQVSSSIFAALRCRQLSETTGVLEVDYAVVCTGAGFAPMRWLARLLVLAVPLGFPATLLGLLWRHVRAAEGASLWSFDAEGGLYSSPALDDLGNVYVGGVDSYLYALRADTGLLKWKFRASAAIYSSPATAPSQRFPGGLVFVGATDWKLYAVRADDGLLAWNQTLRRSSSGQTTQEESLSSSDVTNVTSNVTTNVTANVPVNVTNATTEVSYYATAAKTPYVSSSVRERADAARVLEAEGVCPPNLAQGVGEETSLRFGANVVLTCGRDSRSVGVVASPVYAVGSNSLGDDLGVVYVGSSDKSFYAVTAETGKVKWRLDVDGAVATSAAIDADGRLYFATDTGVVYQVAENATERSGTESGPLV